MKRPFPFIIITGPVGAGKTTQVEALKRFLAQRYPSVPAVFTKSNENEDPFCMALHYAMRRRGSRTPIAPLAELLASFAIRAQHAQKILLPAIERGALVVQNRYISDSYAMYCSAKSATDPRLFKAMADQVLANIPVPDLVFYLDVDPEIGTARKVRSGAWKRFKKTTLDDHIAVRKGYSDFFRQWSEYTPIHIDSTKNSKKKITAKITRTVSGLLRKRYGLRPRC